MAAVRHLGFVGGSNGTTHEHPFMVAVRCKNDRFLLILYCSRRVSMSGNSRLVDCIRQYARVFRNSWQRVGLRQLSGNLRPRLELYARWLEPRSVCWTTVLDSRSAVQITAKKTTARRLTLWAEEVVRQSLGDIRGLLRATRRCYGRRRLIRLPGLVCLQWQLRAHGLVSWRFRRAALLDSWTVEQFAVTTTASRRATIWAAQRQRWLLR